MREPSTAASKWAWWEAAIAGEDPPRYEDEPHVGFYRMRKWSRLPYWLPARVDLVSPIDEDGQLTDPEYYVAEIDGKRTNALRVWTWLHPVTEDEYKWLRALSPLLPKKPPVSQAEQQRNLRKQQSQSGMA
jgi:hypothetical protein